MPPAAGKQAFRECSQTIKLWWDRESPQRGIIITMGHCVRHLTERPMMQACADDALKGLLSKPSKDHTSPIR